MTLALMKAGLLALSGAFYVDMCITFSTSTQLNTFLVILGTFWFGTFRPFLVLFGSLWYLFSSSYYLFVAVGI